MDIAIVGTGISGLGAAAALHPMHDITVFEARHRPGGHSHTVEVDTAAGPVAVDTGFIVYNERTYPNLVKLFHWLDVPTEESDMSFAFSHAGTLEYSGSLWGLLRSPRQLASPRYRRMVSDILRFRKAGLDMLDTAGDAPLAEVLDTNEFSAGFTEDYLLPMAAAIWSARVEDIRRFPAASFLRFFANHGLIRVTDRPQWRTVTGGSREYVNRLAQPFADRVRYNSPVTSIVRRPEHVEIVTAAGVRGVFDQVVIGSHSDQALRMLGNDASRDERSILGSLRYEPNRAVLHSDERLMPQRRAVWSSWNYQTGGANREHRPASVTYWMNRLQNLRHAPPLFVTLNPYDDPDPRLVHGEFEYAHPQFDASAVHAQRQIDRIQGVNRTWFAGAYTGYGFHEDGLRSGLGVAAALGARAPWHGQPQLEPVRSTA